MIRLLNVLGVDEVEMTVKVSKSSLFDAFSHVDTIVTIGDKVIKLDCEENLVAALINYIEELPSLTKKNYILFLNTSQYKTVCISYDELAAAGILILDKPCSMVEGVSLISKLHHYSKYDPSILKQFKYINSYYEYDDKFVIRGVTKVDYDYACSKEK